MQSSHTLVLPRNVAALMSGGRAWQTCAASLMWWLTEAPSPSGGSGHPRTVEGCGSAAEESTVPGRACCEAARRFGALGQQWVGQD